MTEASLKWYPACVLVIPADQKGGIFNLTLNTTKSRHRTTILTHVSLQSSVYSLVLIPFQYKLLILATVQLKWPCIERANFWHRLINYISNFEKSRIRSAFVEIWILRKMWSHHSNTVKQAVSSWKKLLLLGALNPHSTVNNYPPPLFFFFCGAMRMVTKISQCQYNQQDQHDKKSCKYGWSRPSCVYNWFKTHGNLKDLNLCSDSVMSLTVSPWQDEAKPFCQQLIFFHAIEINFFINLFLQHITNLCWVHFVSVDWKRAPDFPNQ